MEKEEKDKTVSEHSKQNIDNHGKAFKMVGRIACGLWVFLTVVVIAQNCLFCCTSANKNLAALTDSFVIAQKKIPQMPANTHSYKMEKFDSVSVAKTVNMLIQKNDSLFCAIDYYQKTLALLEKNTEARHNDIRQETNNIINKFNGAISLWLVIFGLLCGLAPILLAFFNWRHDTEFLKQVANTLDEKKEYYNTKVQEIDRVIKNANDSQAIIPTLIKKGIDEQKKQVIEQAQFLELLQSYLHISSITKRSQFQNSVNRKAITESLLFSLITDGLNVLKQSESDNYPQQRFIQCIDILLEGIQHLQTLNDDRNRNRLYIKVVDTLKGVQDDFYQGKKMKKEKITAIKDLLEQIKNTITAFNHEKENKSALG